tara:strand:- start:24 stop:602 length:579 start_codon:yes stop_codon:yes gene_type:complete
MQKNKHRFFLYFIFFILFSCQPIEVLDDVTIDYAQLPKIGITAEQIKVNLIYEPKFEDPYIDHSLERTPNFYLSSWLKNNINIVGDQNILSVNIFDASIKKSEIPNINTKKYEEKTIFLFEITFLVEFVLYDESNFILASSIVEAKRSTTSGKYISIQENERIIDLLIIDCLIDFAKKSNELINKHMHNYIL